MPARFVAVPRLPKDAGMAKSTEKHYLHHLPVVAERRELVMLRRRAVHQERMTSGPSSFVWLC